MDTCAVLPLNSIDCLQAVWLRLPSSSRRSAHSVGPLCIIGVLVYSARFRRWTCMVVYSLAICCFWGVLSVALLFICDVSFVCSNNPFIILGIMVSSCLYHRSIIPSWFGAWYCRSPRVSFFYHSSSSSEHLSFIIPRIISLSSFNSCYAFATSPPLHHPSMTSSSLHNQFNFFCTGKPELHEARMT